MGRHKDKGGFFLKKKNVTYYIYIVQRGDRGEARWGGMK